MSLCWSEFPAVQYMYSTVDTFDLLADLQMERASDRYLMINLCSISSTRVILVYYVHLLAVMESFCILYIS